MKCEAERREGLGRGSMCAGGERAIRGCRKVWGATCVRLPVACAHARLSRPNVEELCVCSAPKVSENLTAWRCTVVFRHTETTIFDPAIVFLITHSEVRHPACQPCFYEPLRGRFRPGAGSDSGPASAWSSVPHRFRAWRWNVVRVISSMYPLSVITPFLKYGNRFGKWARPSTH